MHLLEKIKQAIMRPEFDEVAVFNLILGAAIFVPLFFLAFQNMGN